jgi:hypothetical protein
MAISFTPPSPLNGGTLVTEIEAEGFTNVQVWLDGGLLWVTGEVTSTGAEINPEHEATIQPVITAHTGAASSEETSKRTRNSRIAQLAALSTLTASEQTEAVMLLLDRSVDP